jgi:hypothetical protein
MSRRQDGLSSCLGGRPTTNADRSYVRQRLNSERLGCETPSEQGRDAAGLSVEAAAHMGCAISFAFIPAA